MNDNNDNKVVIIGSGPAGYTAAIYAARANLSPILIEGFFSGPPGGQLMTTTDVENFPGFPGGIEGPKLMHQMREQAIKFGTKIIGKDVKSLIKEGDSFTTICDGISFKTPAIIIATGATAKRMDIPGAGDNEFWQRGVTACAVCDGAAPIFRNKDLFVIGGGDSAAEEALFLTKYASTVYLVHRRDSLRASKAMAEKVLQHKQIKILWNSAIVKIEGDDVVRSVIIKNLIDQSDTTMVAAGVFFAIGHTPNTAFLNGMIALDDSGYIVTKNHSTQTSVDGVFAAGDVQDKIYRQAITAAGSGCMAAIDVERWLSH